MEESEEIPESDLGEKIKNYLLEHQYEEVVEIIMKQKSRLNEFKNFA